MMGDSRPLAPSLPPSAVPTNSAPMGGGVAAATGGTAFATPTMARINATLSEMSNEQLMEMLSQLKKMAINHPGQTRSLLGSNPTLTYAVMQALLLMNLVDPSVVQRIVATPSSSQVPTPASPPGVPSPTGGASMEPQQQAQIINQIMSLTPLQIDALPPQQREQVLQLVRAHSLGCRSPRSSSIIETSLFPDRGGGASAAGPVISSAILWWSPIPSSSSPSRWSMNDREGERTR